MWRSDDRFDARLNVDFLVSVVGKEGHLMCRARNLSSGGVQLQRDFDTLRPGGDFEIDLRLPDLPGPIGCAGTVVYTRGPVAGVCFTLVPPHGQAMIDAFLAAELARLDARQPDTGRALRERRPPRRARRLARTARLKERHPLAPLR